MRRWMGPCCDVVLVGRATERLGEVDSVASRSLVDAGARVACDRGGAADLARLVVGEADSIAASARLSASGGSRSVKRAQESEPDAEGGPARGPAGWTDRRRPSADRGQQRSAEVRGASLEGRQLEMSRKRKREPVRCGGGGAQGGPSARRCGAAPPRHADYDEPEHQGSRLDRFQLAAGLVQSGMYLARSLKSEGPERAVAPTRSKRQPPPPARLLSRAGLGSRAWSCSAVEACTRA